jgi:MYXO-CTERM domain-containing protein
MTIRAWAAAIVALGVGAAILPGRAHAFCRTTTAPFGDGAATTHCYSDPPPGYQGLVLGFHPLYWPNACVGYSIQKDASHQVSFDQISAVAAKSFAKWTGVSCPLGDAGTSKVSIEVRDLGPVACNAVQANLDGPNQHVIIFHDGSWPHNDGLNTLALTTVTYFTDTGELWDADIEINSAQNTISVGDPVAKGGFDLESILTHEAGHFLGLAHTTDAQAVMYWEYQPDSTRKRTLTGDDVAGICTVYRPDGTRSVDPAVAAGAMVPAQACDPTPRGGEASNCAAPPKGCGCGVAPNADSAIPMSPALVLGTAMAAALRRRRARALERRVPPGTCYLCGS